MESLNACTTNGQDQSQSYRPDERALSAYSPITVSMETLWMRESCSFIKKGVQGKSALQSLWERRCFFPLAARAFEERRVGRGLTMSPLPHRIFTESFNSIWLRFSPGDGNADLNFAEIRIDGQAQDREARGSGRSAKRRSAPALSRATVATGIREASAR